VLRPVGFHGHDCNRRRAFHHRDTRRKENTGKNKKWKFVCVSLR
jgi:hypothetical protein